MLGDHFYTISALERDTAQQKYGYKSEGIACYVFPTQTLNTVPLYRLWHPNCNDHFYTISASERDSAKKTGWTRDEGIQCFVFAAQVLNSIPLFRLWNGSDHFYTTSASERDFAIKKARYEDEGSECYVYGEQIAGTIALYRLYKVAENVPEEPQSPPVEEKAQLVFINTWLYPTSFPREAQDFTVCFSFANIGRKKAENFKIKLILTNRDTNLQILTDEIHVPSFDSGKQDIALWPFTRGLPQGHYAVDAYLDVYNEVSETVEGLQIHHNYNGFNVYKKE